nr:MAG TPA: hypothetical protein [Caudoviricetes sp.]
MLEYARRVQREVVVDRILNNRERKRCFKFNRSKWTW